MPTNFYTLYGSNLHGAKITWGNDPAASGDRILTIAFDLNWYSAKFTPGRNTDWQFRTTNWSTETHLNTAQFEKVVRFQFTWQNPASG